MAQQQEDQEQHRSPSEDGITDVSAVLKHAIKHMPQIFDSTELSDAPVALFYDLDLWDKNFESCKSSFGNNFHHFMAIKGNSISKMICHAFHKHNIGVECASIGEVLHAINHCCIPKHMIVFDSPCKTYTELCFAIKEQIHCNLDNFIEFERSLLFLNQNPHIKTGGIGLRINPLVGAGKIKALSVSTNESKFGIPISQREKLIQTYLKNPWLNSVHVHVGSGGMGAQILCAGIRKILDFAIELNQKAKIYNNNKTFKQIHIIDIGGGLPVNYWGDSLASNNIPTFQQYAIMLKKQCYELFSGEFKILTELGQSLNAKFGFLASRIEFVKLRSMNSRNDVLQNNRKEGLSTEQDEEEGVEKEDRVEKEEANVHQLAIVHFGADCCPRQVYAPDSHARRIEAYQANGDRFQIDKDNKNDDDDDDGSGGGGDVSERKRQKIDQATQRLKYQNKAKSSSRMIATSIGGPLCFQGDFLAQNLKLPYHLKEKDFITLKDTGANTISLFSRHCSRLCPPVYGYRRQLQQQNMNGIESNEIESMIELKPRETFEELSNFWGPV